MKELNATQQAIIMSFFDPFVDVIVDRVSERILSVTAKKEPKFYTRKEAAEILHVTLPTLARITKDGLLVAKHVGSRILYEADAIDARRVISTLRNDEGWDIKDVRLDDRRKLYWLEPDKRQMSIDWEVNGNE